MKVNVNGVWKDSKPHVNVQGVWKPVDKGYVNVNGVWKEFYTAWTHSFSPQYQIQTSQNYVVAIVNPSGTQIGDIQPRTAGPDTLYAVKFQNLTTGTPPDKDGIYIEVAYTGVRRTVIVTLPDGRAFNIPWNADYPNALSGPYTRYAGDVTGVLSLARTWVGQTVPLSIHIT